MSNYMVAGEPTSHNMYNNMLCTAALLPSPHNYG